MFGAAACKLDNKLTERSPLGVEISGLPPSKGISEIQELGIPEMNSSNVQSVFSIPDAILA